MTAYQSQPIFSGQVSGLASLFRAATSQIVRIGVLGDSRTDPFTTYADRRLECRLNYNAYKTFGQASETPIARAGLATRSSTVDPQFCIPTAVAYGTKLTNDDSATIAEFEDLPPGFSLYQMQTSSATRGVSIGLDPRCTAINGTWGDFAHGDKADYFPNSNIVCEAFFRNQTTLAAPKIQWVDVEKASATPTTSISGFSASANEDFNNNGSDTGVTKYTSSIHTTPASGNYINAVFSSLTAASAVYTGANGHQFAGARFKQSGISKGVVFQSFGASGYDAAEVLDRHGSMGPTLNTFGPYHAWIIILGANDYGSPTYATPTTNYKQKIQDIIDFVRTTEAGGTSRTPVVLLNPYSRPSAQATFDIFTEQLIELTTENDDVCFLNIARVIEEAGYEAGDTTWTNDDIHFSAKQACTIYSDAIWNGLMNMSNFAVAPTPTVLENLRTMVTNNQFKPSALQLDTPKIDLHRRTTLYAAGDSITLGSGASTSAEHFINIIGTDQGITIDDTVATSGRGVWQAAKLLNALSLTKTTSALHWMVGFNDLRRATNHVKTRRKIAACISSALLAMWGDVYTDAQDESVTTGSGTYGSYNAASVGGKFTTGRTIALNAGSLTWSFTGDKFGIGFAVNSGDVETYGDANIYVDDILVDRVSLNNWMDYVSDGSNDNRRGPMGRLITGLPYKAHTVRIVRTSVTGTVPVDYFCTILDPTDCPPVILADCPRMPAAGYVLAPANSSDEQVANLNSMQRSIVDHYASLGFPIVAGETGKYYDPDTEIHTDNIHPNSTGHANIARALQESITFGMPLPQKAIFVSNFDSGVQALVGEDLPNMITDSGTGAPYFTDMVRKGVSYNYNNDDKSKNVNVTISENS